MDSGLIPSFSQNLVPLSHSRNEKAPKTHKRKKSKSKKPRTKLGFLGGGVVKKRRCVKKKCKTKPKKKKGTKKKTKKR